MKTLLSILDTLEYETLLVTLSTFCFFVDFIVEFRSWKKTPKASGADPENAKQTPQVSKVPANP